MNPARHGVFGALKRKPGSYHQRPVNALDVRVQSLFSYLDALGVRCLLIGLPLTFPPLQLRNGVCVAGWPAPRKANAFWPSGLNDKARQVFGRDYDPYPFPPGVLIKQLGPEVMDNYLFDSIDQTTELTCWLASESEYDLIAVVYLATDLAGHCYAFEPELLKRVYRAMDDAIGKLLQHLPPQVCEDVVIFSDHGHAAQGTLRFHVNEFLKQRGWLKLKGNRGIVRNIMKYLPSWDDLAYASQRIGLSKARYLLPARIKDYLRDILPVNPGGISLAIAGIDWIHTRCYSPQAFMIYINQKGREPLGCIEPDSPEYWDVVTTCVANIADVIDPRNGKQLFDVYGPQALYQGFPPGEAPDIVFVPKDWTCNAPTSLTSGRVFVQEHQGEHRLFGALITRGRNFASGVTAPVSLVDLLPTCITALGHPIPKDLDGHPVSRLLANPNEAANWPTVTQRGQNTHVEVVYLPEEEEELKRRLSDLGYL